MKKFRSGFTLVELIIVIAIIAILAGAIFVAIDPARRLHETRNARRASDIATILDAIKTYQVDNEGSHFGTIAGLGDNVLTQLGTASSGCVRACGSDTTDTACVDISAMGSNYLTAVPFDPQGGTAEKTGYALIKDSNGALTLIACGSEGEGAGGNGTPPTIQITR
jgi:prepilin-type N-terminal cleavage/methylation domain-containing protein